MAWAPTEEQLYVLSGRTVADSWTLYRIDGLELRIEASTEVSAAIGVLTVDGDGNALLASSDGAGSARILEWNDDGLVAVSELPHPRFQRLIWTPTGLLGIEYSSTEPIGSEPPDAARLVRIDVDGRRGSLEALTEFDQAIIDLAVTPDVLSIATAKRIGDGHALEIKSDAVTQRIVDEGITSVDIRPDGTSVGYRGNDGYFRVWRTDQSVEAVIADHSTTSATLSSNGLAALAEQTDSGPSGEVCVVDTAGLEYLPIGR
jgi:hypothetical protein